MALGKWLSEWVTNKQNVSKHKTTLENLVWKVSIHIFSHMLFQVFLDGSLVTDLSFLDFSCFLYPY